MNLEKTIKLIFSPDPSLIGGETRRTEVIVSEDETMKDILERVKMLLCIWLNDIGNKTDKEYQLSIEGRIQIDLRYTPKELHLVDGQILYVNLKKEVPSNPLDTMVGDGEIGDVFTSSPSSFLNETSDFDACYSSHNDIHMPTEEDILRFEEAKQAALARARDIERIKGINYVSHRKILHDEAVDDYEEEGYEEEGYGEEGYGEDGYEDYEYFEDGRYENEERKNPEDVDYINQYYICDKSSSSGKIYPNVNISNNNKRSYSRNNPLCPFK